MAKIDLKFLDYLYDDTSISVENEVTEYYDAIKDEKINTNVLRINLNSESLKYEGFIDLDISTAIKFAKTLRTEINKAKEAQNG
jgi:hypothetical protein